MSGVEDNPLGLPSESPVPEPQEEPAADASGRHDEVEAGHDTETRDATPALGTRGEPASWRSAAERKHVALARPSWGDAGWSFLYGPDTRYGDGAPEEGEVAEANRRARDGPMPDDLRGPFMKAPVWTWEVPLYFWVGGIAAGASGVSLAADLAGDEWSASVARKVALVVVLPAPVLLIADLGRPARFLNMLRIFKPRSPMNLGAWCLAAFTAVGASAVAADVLGQRRAARGLGAVTALLGGYLGSYTGVLLASTAVPVWARSRLFLGPIFVSTATATGAATTRLALVATRRRSVRHPTRVALNRLSAGAMLAELTLSKVNERRLGPIGGVLSEGRPGRLFSAAQALVLLGVALNLLGPRRVGARGQDVAGALYLAGGLAFRFGWIEAGRASAQDDEAVARIARGGATADEPVREGTEHRILSEDRPPAAGGAASAAARAWSRTVGRASLLVERLLRPV